MEVWQRGLLKGEVRIDGKMEVCGFCSDGGFGGVFGVPGEGFWGTGGGRSEEGMGF
ncbi:MAG: hypothetical protein HFG59_01465 [Lachnospiraceae bacterium]|nr:hypothetical protein [Lachnospiraceae bacterium]